MTASREKSLPSKLDLETRPGNSRPKRSRGEQQEVGGVANSFLPSPPLEAREHVEMGRLEELVSPGNGLVSKSHFARSRAFVAIENSLEDLSWLSLSLVPYRQISQRIPVFEWEVRERERGLDRISGGRCVVTPWQEWRT